MFWKLLILWFDRKYNFLLDKGNSSVSIFGQLKNGGGLKFALDFDLLFSNQRLNLNTLLNKEYFY